MVVKKKLEILEVESNQPFRLIALSSSLNLNRMVWGLNAGSGIKLIKNSDMEQTLGVPVFTDRVSKFPVVISLISNKPEKSRPVKQLPNVDYIVEVNGLMPESEFKLFVQGLKKVDGVLAAIEINTTTLKRKEPFCPE
ncbi:MAG: IPExxxVDY family protein [Bacteroidales bacterium]